MKHASPYKHIERSEEQEAAVIFRTSRDLKRKIAQKSLELKITPSQFLRSAIKYFMESLENEGKK